MNKKISNVVRILARMVLGGIFIFFGIGGLFQIFPISEDAPLSLILFTEGVKATKYFLPLTYTVEIICGVLLLAGIFVPLALIMIAPVVVNILLFHIFVNPGGILVAILIGVLTAYLAFFSQPYSSIVKQIFRCPLLEAKKNKKA